MTRFVAEPTVDRDAAQGKWGTQDLRLRPAPLSAGVAVYEIKVFDDQTANAVLDDAFVWEIPEDLDASQIIKVEAFISTAGDSATTVNIRAGAACASGSDILTTPITIDAGDCNSKDASAQPVISGGAYDVSWGDHLHIDVDAAGGGKGLGVIVTLVPNPIGSLTIQGAQGAQGAQGDPGAPGGINSWSGAWDSGTTYAADDAVSHNGSSWVAITGSTNVEPGTVGSEEEWMLLAEGASTADLVAIDDTGDYFSGTDVEAALQELGAAGLGTGNQTGWTSHPDTWTYASATTFTVADDVTGTFTKGTRIKLTQSSTVKYFVVVDSSHSAGTTTVTITGGSDYTLANSAISDVFYSYQANPQGYPDWFNYTPTYGGFSSAPAVGGGVIQFRVEGRICTFQHYAATNGTSNASTFTVSVPVAPLSTNYVVAAGRGINNGSELTTGPSLVEVGTSIVIYLTWRIGGTAWTASGGKNCYFMVSYPI